MTTRTKSMTTKQYLSALRTLGLSPYSKQTCEVLGIGSSTASNYAAGKALPKPIQLLIEALIENDKLRKRLRDAGLPEE
jgi:hypothetical protein